MREILALGPKFSLPTEHNAIPLTGLLASVENIIQNEQTESKDIFRNKVVYEITKYLKQYKQDNKQIVNNIKETKKFLNNNKDIIITRSDKSNSTVCLNRDQYNEKMQQLLQDKEVYKELTTDPTNRFETKTNKIIKEMHNKNYIDQRTYRQLIKHNSVSPKIYGIPKTHKKDVPLRPIVSNIDSHTKNLAKFLAKILEVSFTDFCQYKVKDTFQFSNLVNNMNIGNSDKLVSFDVTSLFTNIPISLVIEIIQNNWNLIEHNTTIPKTEFINALKWVFNTVYFTYNGICYQQINGTPMGSSLSPIIAEIIMNEIIRYVIGNCHGTIKAIHSYVDDIFAIVEGNNISKVLDLFNRYHQKLDFTYEIETNNTLPFLDTLVIRHDNTLKTRWYRKPTNSNRFINYQSFCWKKHKINLIKGLIYRIRHISHETYIKEDLNILTAILMNNNYPKFLINKLIFSSDVANARNIKRTSNEAQGIHMNNERTNDKQYVVLPYIEGLSNKIKDIFKELPFNITYYNHSTIRNLFSRLKDKTEVLNDNCLVYKIQCKTCGIQYIGNTVQRMKNRLTQHKSDAKVKPKSCSMANHLHTYKHELDMNNVEMLFKEHNNFKRAFLETLAINVVTPNCNNKKDTENFSNIYLNLLQFIRIKGYKFSNKDDTPPIV